jgi:hypothetical protein
MGTFWRGCCFFGARQEPKHCNLQRFAPLAWKKCFLQHAENGVNTHVFARHEPKNTVNTCKYYDFCYQRKNIVNTVVLDFRGEKKHPYLQCFLNAKTPPI